MSFFLRMLLYGSLVIFLSLANVKALQNWEFWAIMGCVILIDWVSSGEYKTIINVKLPN